MKHRLILVEGIPGSGKSTLSGKLSRHISRKYVKSNLWHEFGWHPANLIDWSAAVPLGDFDNITAKYPKYEEKIREKMYIDGEYAIVFTKFNILKKDQELLNLLGSYGISGGNSHFDLYSSLHFNKWAGFAKTQNDENNPQRDEVTIFECAFLQEHISELMMFREKNETEIIDYMKKLTDSVMVLNPLLIYLRQKDVRETLRRVSEFRLKEGWGDRVAKMIENSSYGKTHNLKGFDGMAEFFSKKKEMDHKVASELPIKTIFIDNDDYGWDEVWRRIKDEIDKIFADDQ